jgi:exopolyphosphatase/guanosine-5'-triphosphate,3'-diphosphate pyrophosphatase
MNNQLTTETTNASPRLVAVIDIGASSLRMQIAEIHDTSGRIRKVESFSQAVSIGVDSFSRRYIDKGTVEDCVNVLHTYRKTLDEYGITEPHQIRVVATSGVREANNRIQFIDRIFVATGFQVEPFDEAELHRVTYLGILPFIENQPKYFADESLIIEVGGGTSEILLLRQSDVQFSRTFRLGSLRLRHNLQHFDGPSTKTRGLIEAQISKTIDEFESEAKNPAPRYMIAMGGDVRFAAKQITQKPVEQKLVELKLPQLVEFTENVLQKSPNQLATKYHMGLPDAKSLGPGLLTQVMFAQRFQIKKFLVAQVNLRDGLIQEMSREANWGASVKNQVVRSAMQLGRKFKFNESHSVHVSKLACSLFDQLIELHRLPHRYRAILEIASLVHDIGYYVSSKARHKHSMYLIQNSEIFGVGSHELNLLSLVARYHRGAMPNVRHEGYSQLERAERVAVAKLASILRMSKALDVSQKQRIQAFHCSVSSSLVEFTTTDVVDLALESLELKQVSTMFEDLFGTEVALRAGNGK